MWEIQGGWLTKLIARRGFGAITLGDAILYADGSLPMVLRDHELVHVRQGRRWGPLFLPAYGLESLWQRAHGRDLYWDNRFERQAYESDARRREPKVS